MKTFVHYIFLALLLAACSEKKEQSPEEVNGKYVKTIQHYIVHFEDGTSYDMDEKATKKIFYLIRHAEKDTFPVGDPNLSQAGLERSSRLADIFSGTQLDAVYSTMTTRTLFTVDSLSDLKGLVTFPYEAKNFKKVAEDLMASLDTHKTLIVGHSNTTPVIANHLYGSEYFKKTIDESDYENLYIVLERNDGSKEMLALKYR